MSMRRVQSKERRENLVVIWSPAGQEYDDTWYVSEVIIRGAPPDPSAPKYVTSGELMDSLLKPWVFAVGGAEAEALVLYAAHGDGRVVWSVEGGRRPDIFGERLGCMYRLVKTEERSSDGPG